MLAYNLPSSECLIGCASIHYAYGDVVQEGDNYVVKHATEAATASPGRPMTWEELEQEIDEAEEDIKAGRTYTSEELLNDFKTLKQQIKDDL